MEEDRVWMQVATHLGVSMNGGTSIAGWFISHGKPQTWMITGGNPYDLGNPHIHFWEMPIMSFLVQIDGPDWHTIYHRLPVVEGVNKPLYSGKGHLWEMLPEVYSRDFFTDVQPNPFRKPPGIIPI